MHRYVKDLTGQTFGRLHVLCAAARPENSKGRGQHWACICSCTNEIVVRSDSLLQGKSTSCGCTNESTTRMRAAIGPRRPKSTVSEHPDEAPSENHPNIDSNMSETNATISNTIAVNREELEAMRNTLANVGPGTLLNANNGVKGALDRILSDAPKASYANENDQPRQPRSVDPFPGMPVCGEPRTVKGETMGEQTTRLAGDVVPSRSHEMRNGLQKLELSQTGLRWTDGESHITKNAERIANNKATSSPREHAHYFKECPFDEVDVYRLYRMFNITDQAIGHALKKLLVAGGRGAGKSAARDVKEAVDTLRRWQELEQEDANAHAFHEAHGEG